METKKEEKKAEWNDCTDCGPIIERDERERKIPRISGFVIPLLIGLFQLFVIILGIVYIVSFIIWLFS